MLCEQAQRTSPGQWVRVVGGWTDAQSAQKRLPTVSDLNAAAPDIPGASASGTSCSPVQP
jgi:predicted amidohydrolase YtcJ